MVNAESVCLFQYQNQSHSGKFIGEHTEIYAVRKLMRTTQCLGNSCISVNKLVARDAALKIHELETHNRWLVFEAKIARSAGTMT